MTSTENITKAFESGVLTSKQTLEAKVEANELAKKKKIASICKKGIFGTNSSRERLINASNVPYRDSSGITIEDEDVPMPRSFACNNITVIKGQCDKCKNLDKNFIKYWNTLKCIPTPLQISETAEDSKKT